jgi:hypothetical protein
MSNQALYQTQVRRPGLLEWVLNHDVNGDINPNTLMCSPLLHLSQAARGP